MLIIVLWYHCLIFEYLSLVFILGSNTWVGTLCLKQVCFKLKISSSINDGFGDETITWINDNIIYQLDSKKRALVKCEIVIKENTIQDVVYQISSISAPMCECFYIRKQSHQHPMSYRQRMADS